MLSESKRSMAAGGIAGGAVRYPCAGGGAEPAYVRTVFDQTNGLPTDEANAVQQTRDGYPWVGSYGGLLLFDGSEFHNFSTKGAIATPGCSSTKTASLPPPAMPPTAA